MRPYQRAAVDEIDFNWLIGNRNIFLRMDTGAGKTVVIADVIGNHNGFVAAIAHRDKLVEQMSIMLARAGVVHDVIASEKTKKLITKKHVKKFGRCFYVPGARCRVASVQTLVRAKDLEKWASQVTLWLVDECFPAGTLVDDQPIESLKPGDLVTAFDEKTGNFEKRPVVQIFKNKAPENMMRLVIGGRHVIRCTLGHPFWTRRGWVDAAALTAHDEVLYYEIPARPSLHSMQRPGGEIDGKSSVSVATDGSHLLLNHLRDDASGSASGSNSTQEKRTGNMLDLPKTNGFDGTSDQTVSRDRASILQQGMFFGVSGEGELPNNGSDQPGVCFGSNDEEQPNAQFIGPREGQPGLKSERPQTNSTGREWEGSPCRDYAYGDFGGLGFFGTKGHSDENVAEFRIPDMLQTGCGERDFENSDRSGWPVSFDQSWTREGSEEGRISCWLRVDHVEVYERADPRNARYGPDDGFVYNIEVEGLHTYTANGVTVHNCHHLLKENQWGKAIQLFNHPSCKGLGLTATPGRPDGKGLGRHADGFADVMVEGPPMRWLIDQGYLCDYDVVCPPSDMHVEGAPGASGEYSPTQLKSAARESHIVGDVADHYLKFARGLSGITFSSDIETAVKTVAEYRSRGVSAELITGDTDTTIRDDIFERSERGELNQIVAVDVISEGVDIPALQVGSFARPTGSIITWRQQLGRLLRPIYADGFDLETQAGRLAAIAASPKPRALLIDHVSGFLDPSLGAPDRPREWSLDRREKRAKNDNDGVPMTRCVNPVIDCFHPYPRIHRACPKCGYAPEPASRSAPEQVDGDLQMLTPEALAMLQGRVLDVTMSRAQHDANQLAKGAKSAWLSTHWEQYREKREHVLGLLESMDVWAGRQHAAGLKDHEIQRLFFHSFGHDVLSAQGLPPSETAILKERIDEAVNRA